MYQKITSHLSQRLVSRWIILLIDLSITFLGLIFAYFLRFNFEIPVSIQSDIKYQAPIILAIYLIGFLLFKPFTGIIRYSSLEDVSRILWSNLFALGLMISLNLSVDFIQVYPFLRTPISVIIIEFLMITFVMVGLRFFIRGFYSAIGRTAINRKSVMIYGAGHSGLITKHALSKERSIQFKVVAFIDDDPEKVGKQIEGASIISLDKVSNDFIKRNQVQEVIIATQTMDSKRKQDVIDHLVNFDLKVQVVPPTTKWINGELTTGQIRKVNINDLLGRPPIRLDSLAVKHQLKGSVVLITGAAGSIGSELARQIYSYHPERLVLIDQAESPLHELMLELRNQSTTHFDHVVRSYIADITDYGRMDHIFSIYQPHMIYHAAAYKHVPMMEAHPSEAIQVNVLGTAQLADLAVKYRAKEFVMVSTDKAVNPTNVMGASKRIAEMYCQSYSKHTNTKFVTTRFGNVLGSNGSVIPLFQKQIAAGGPLTVTHSEVTRYFMTIPEACELVLEASVMGNGGEVYVFDMGKPVKIINLAKKMIQLSGLEEGKDIEIKVTGLRPGEKLYEELLSDNENTKETHHPKIQVADVRPVKHAYIEYQLTLLNEALKNHSADDIVRVMKTIVPEFVSKNSEFEKFDQVKGVGA